MLPNLAFAEIFRWVDENGKVHFSDRVPPEASKLERHVLDQRGNLRDVLARQRTVEELAAHRKRLLDMQDEAQQRSRQDEYDRYLWTTFDNLEELEALRTERIEIRDEQIRKIKDRIQSLQIALDNAREQQTRRALAQQNLIRGLEDDIAHMRRQIDDLETARREEFDGLSKDMRRYEYLRLRRAVGAGLR